MQWAASRRPIYTVAIGQAAPHAVLMFHNASMGAQDELPHLIQRVSLFVRICATYEQHISERSGMPVDEFRAHEAMQWWMTADEALAAGMADAIGLSPRYPVQ